MPFGRPGRLVAEALGQDDEADHLRRVRAARNGDADPAHPVPLLIVPPLNIRCHTLTKRIAPISVEASFLGTLSRIGLAGEDAEDVLHASTPMRSTRA
jgi:hypothetical protein